MVKKKTDLHELSKEIAMQTSGENIMRDKVVISVEKKIVAAEASQDIILTRYLDSNSRRDRDALIKKREQIITYKTLLKNELFQSDK